MDGIIGRYIAVPSKFNRSPFRTGNIRVFGICGVKLVVAVGVLGGGTVGVRHQSIGGNGSGDSLRLASCRFAPGVVVGPGIWVVRVGIDHGDAGGGVNCCSI